jgi:hypothetical protein
MCQIQSGAINPPPNGGVQADAAGAALNLGAAFQRSLLPPVRAFTTVASSATDAAVSPLITALPTKSGWLIEHFCLTSQPLFVG